MGDDAEFRLKWDDKNELKWDQDAEDFLNKLLRHNNDTPMQPVKQQDVTEMCLFCNLKNLFTEFSQSQTGDALRPEHVRQALEKINYGTLQGADFIEGNMGCA